MATKATRRGFDSEDRKRFSPENISRLAIAQEEVQWLVDRGYSIGPTISFIGSRYQFSSRQRTALQRAISAKDQYKRRASAMLPFTAAKDGCLYIDGFNLIITLEVALSGSLMILGNDGVLRDLAGLRGSYRLIDKTDKALDLIGKAFNELQVPEAVFYLDAPVSNSGRLKARILDKSKEWNTRVAVELVPNSDIVLSKMGRVVTADSIILDQCDSWFNLSKKIVEDYIKDAWIINFKK
jgi:hypothetical protein